MKPYYENAAKGVVLYCGDALDVLPTLKSSVGAVIADPPYGTTACEWDEVISLQPLWEQLKRLLAPRRAVVLTASQPFTTTLVQSNREWFKYCWVWLKSQLGDPMNAKNRPMKSHEDVVVFSDGTTANKSERRMLYSPQGLTRQTTRRKNRYRLDGQATFKPKRPSHQTYYEQEFTNYPTSILDFGLDRAEEGRHHPTQKPVALLDYLVCTYTNQTDVVLDFCFGSGTTAVACVETGRKFIGCELSEEYCEIAARRIEAASPGLFVQKTKAAVDTTTLFDAPPTEPKEPNT